MPKVLVVSDRRETSNQGCEDHNRYWLGYRMIKKVVAAVVGSQNLLLRVTGIILLSLVYSADGNGGEIDGQGIVCVSMKKQGEDLFYGFIFNDGKVKALTIVRDGLYVPPDNEDVSYTMNGSDEIVWKSTSSLHETRTPSSGFKHVVDRRTLKHSVFGKKGGFDGGLCFFETGIGVKSHLLQKIQVPQG